MLTREIVRETYQKSTGEEITDGNLSAFMRFAHNFDCMDCESWQEAQDKILTSMEIISEEIQDMDNDEATSILRQRYSQMLGAE